MKENAKAYTSLSLSLGMKPHDRLAPVCWGTNTRVTV